MSRNHQTDIVVIGGGLAGLSLALRLADRFRVTILTKRSLNEGSTRYAQGGIAAVLSPEDSFESHIEDTLVAGAGLCDPEAVRFVVENGPQNIYWLIDQGVQFTRERSEDGESHYHLTREGGHSHRRIIHATDATGKAVSGILEENVKHHPNITVRENWLAIDLITSARIDAAGNNRCLGVYALDQEKRKVRTIRAGSTVLATGGASKAYLYTSNPDTSTGDGIAMAWRAGCRVANMEFMQFHPTCLYHPQAKSFLISEALRGEGALLKLPDGTRFMPEHDPRAELAPRDIVARSIDYEMKKRGLDNVLLDISHKPARFIKSHFPNIYKRCKQYGYDLAREPVPVVPAAHYTCGGVVTDLDARTGLERLYAIGECTYTGLHGANRLASNSLLECLVFSEAAAKYIQANPPEKDDTAIPDWDESRVTDPDEEIVVSHNWDELRRSLWDYVGIVRTNKRLARAERRIELLREEIQEYYSNFRVSNDLIELRDLVQVAELIVRSAQMRKESRGLHYTRDYPETLPDDQAGPTIIAPD